MHGLSVGEPASAALRQGYDDTPAFRTSRAAWSVPRPWPNLRRRGRQERVRSESLRRPSSRCRTCRCGSCLPEAAPSRPRSPAGRSSAYWRSGVGPFQVSTSTIPAGIAPRRPCAHLSRSSKGRTRNRISRMVACGFCTPANRSVLGRQATPWPIKGGSDALTERIEPNATWGVRSGSYSPQGGARDIFGALAPPPKRVPPG